MDTSKLKSQVAETLKAVRDAIAKDPEKGKSSVAVHAGVVAYAREHKFSELLTAMANGGIKLGLDPSETFTIGILDKVVENLP